MDEDFPTDTPYHDYSDTYSKVENIGKYFNISVVDEDVQFFVKFLDINSDLLEEIIETGDKSLVNNFEIPVAKTYELEYSVWGSCTYNDSILMMCTQVARLCNVPAYYISAEMNNSLTYSNVQDERRQFVALSLQPYVSAVESRLSMDDLTPATQFIAFDMDSGFLRANPLERLTVIEKMLQLNLISVEEARQMEELSPNGNN